MIFDILQSRDGLNRYDDVRFKVFSPNPFASLAIWGSEAQPLFEDSRGWIWLVLPEGLDVLDPVSMRFFHVMHEGKPVISRSWSSLAETPDGVIWLNNQYRVWKFNIQKGMLEKALKITYYPFQPFIRYSSNWCIF